MPTYQVDKSKVIQAIEELRVRHGLSVHAFGNRVGISNTYATQLFAGMHKSVGHSTAVKIADAFPGESRIKWLRLAGYGELADELARGLGLEVVPVLGSVAAGAEGSAEYDGEVIVPIGFIQPGEIGLVVSGESMAPNYPPGAIVAVRLTKAVPDKGPVVVLLPTGEHVIKRWCDTPDGPKLCSDNPDSVTYPPIDAGQAEIVGVPLRVYKPQTWEAV